MSPNVKHFVVAGLGYGDEGKGSVTDFLVRKFGAGLVVRYNGGPQAAHNVVAPIDAIGGKAIHHCFAQFGSGTLAGAETYLSDFMAVDPLALMAEARVLKDKGLQPFERLTVDEGCIIVTPFHQLTNQLRELLRGPNRHGSCGMGVGEAILDLERGLPGIRLRDLLLPGSVSNLRNLQESKVEIAENLFAQWDAATNCGSNVKAESEQEIEIKTLVSDLKNPALLRIFLERLVTFLESIQIGDRGTLIEKLKATRSVFEGAQGVLLDRDSGFFPYVTPSNTTFANADEILKPFADEVFRIGIVRGYMTRHGAGPLVTEIDSSLHMNLKDEHNLEGAWQGSLRVGWFDAVAIRHAIRTAGGPNYLDGIAVTNLDRLPADSKFCAAYDTPTERIRDLPDASGPAITDFLTQVQPVCELVHPTELMARIKEELEANIILTSNGPGPEHKTFSTD